MGRIDVVVPCYNYGHYLTQCIDSVLQPGAPDTHVLIIDDCSSDHSQEVAAALAAKDRRISFRRHGVNRGHIATYNEGLEWASADYTLILSADDWVLPGALARAVVFLDTEPTPGFVYGPAVNVREGQPYPPELQAPPLPGRQVMSGVEFLRSCAYWNQVPTCTAVVRTMLQKRIGGYRPELPHAGDLDMWMRFATRASVGRLNAYQGAYRQHNANMSAAYYRRMMLDFSQRKMVLDNLFKNAGDELAEIKAPMWEGLAQAAMHSANDPFHRGDLGQFEEIRNFAASICPEIRKSRHWRVQNMKRVLGPKLCAGLRPLAQQLLRRPERSA